jgi:hypothetical protein
MKFEKYNLKILYLSGISFLGLLFLIILVFWSPQYKIVYSYQKEFILLIFILICISGMLAVIYPSKCTEFINNKKEEDLYSGAGVKKGLSTKFDGHHPLCQNFKTHTFLLMGRRYCAGCAGLFTGAFLAVAGTIFYYFYGNFSESVSILILAVGAGLVFLSLFQNLYFKINNSLARLLFNMMLVIGSFLILIGIMQITGSIFLELYFLILIFVLILTRISISERDHEIICLECREEVSCPYYLSEK